MDTILGFSATTHTRVGPGEGAELSVSPKEQTTESGDVWSRDPARSASFASFAECHLLQSVNLCRMPTFAECHPLQSATFCRMPPSAECHPLQKSHPGWPGLSKDAPKGGLAGGEAGSWRVARSGCPGAGCTGAPAVARTGAAERGRPTGEWKPLWVSRARPL